MDRPSGRLQSGDKRGAGLTVEHRAGVSFRVAGRTLSGRALVYGDTADMGDFRERFEPGAFGEVRSIAINLQHDPRLIVTDSALLTDTARELRVRADLPEGSAALSLVRRGALSGFSIEFFARTERRESGVRVIERAVLSGLALVDAAAYPGAVAEVRRRKYTKGRPARIRAGRVLRSRIPYDRALVCECLRQAGGPACIPLARFSKSAGDGMAEAINDALAEARDVLAVMGEYKRPVGSASRGTLRAVSTVDGLDLEMDLPAGEVGDAVVAAHESAGVVVRPLIDFDRSEFTDSDKGREYTAPFLRAFLIGATDHKGGWPEPRIDYEAEGERAAPAPERRRRVWL